MSKIQSISFIDQKLQNLFLYCSRQKLKVFMFIDEYDNFTNTILTTSGKKEYLNLTQGEGAFRYFFNLLKGLTSKYPDLEYSYLIELKYIPSGEYTEAKLQEKIKEAQKQLDQYAASDRVKSSIGNTQLI